ncbi:hypothetical protein [Burkholderia sp. TSV86]|uniref:hypothetical protein n=1 Tax=Burkholderia sp. TSV86 TaxID=1385594 RepID=UPI00075AE0CB|nr:hypothetical protein [Burkholderia sp. TSV86]KVE32186.1 hypothetical protein WS68_16535 [Burkholderia sp. TSV86]
MQELSLQEIDLVGGAQVGGGLVGALTGLVGVYGQGLYNIGSTITDQLAGGLVGAIQIVGNLPVQLVENVGSAFFNGLFKS